MPAQKSTRWHTFAIRLLVLITLGALTTIAVSWALARFSLVQSARGRFVFDDGDHLWRVTSLGGYGAVLYKWMCAYRWNDSATPEHRAALIAHLTRKDTNDLFGYWSRLPDDAPRPRLGQLQAEAAAQAPTPPQDVSIPTDLRGHISSVTTLPSSMDVYYGLPLPALRFTLHAQDLSEDRSSGALIIESIQTKNLPPFKPTALRLPLIPVAEGFAINTALYTAAWTLPYLLLLGLRRFRTRRRRRGQCPKCAYDLQHKFLDGCPECGWNRKATDTRANRRRNIWGFACRLSLGVLTTLAVAWIGSLFGPDMAMYKLALYDDGAFIWNTSERANAWRRVREWTISWRWRETATPEQRATLIEFFLSPESSVQYSLISESLFRSRQAKLNDLNARFGRAKPNSRLAESQWGETIESYDGIEFIEMESGWPAFAMKSSRVWTGNSLETEGAFVINEHSSRRADLPYHILPLGFLLNTTLVTALLYLPRITTSARRSIRSRRGRCPACATTLGENAPIGCAACGLKPTA